MSSLLGMVDGASKRSSGVPHPPDKGTVVGAQPESAQFGSREEHMALLARGLKERGWQCVFVLPELVPPERYVTSKARARFLWSILKLAASEDTGAYCVRSGDNLGT